MTDSPLDATDLTEAGFIDAVNARMPVLLEGYRDRATAISGSATELVDSIADLVTGGKRMRAVLAWWGWQGAGGDPADPLIVDAAVGLELFQAAALIHDDILDRSDTRRGRPSVHRRFEAIHRDGGWRQDPVHFGTSAAILTGDLCLSLSEEVFAAAADSSRNAAEARALFNEMRFEVMAGQYLDVLDEVEALGQDPATALARARTVLRFKSARYSVVHPLALGGTLGGAEAGLLEGYRRVAEPLGAAFQLRDDLLGVFGDPAVTGKPAGDDLREGKRTTLVAHALMLLPEERAADLDRSLGDPTLTGEDISRLQSLLDDCGARARVEQDVRDLGEACLAALGELRVPDATLAGLSDVAGRILHRDR